MEKGQEVAQAPPEGRLDWRLLTVRHSLGCGLDQRFEIPGSLPQDVLQQGQVAFGQTLVPDQLPGQQQSLGLGAWG